MKLTKFLKVPFFVFAVLGLVACQDNNRQDGNAEDGTMGTENETQVTQTDGMTRSTLEDDDNVFYRTRENSDLSTFSQNMNTPEISDAMADADGEYTIFAPANSAYEEMTEEDRSQMDEQASASFHYLIVEEELTEEELRNEVENANNQYALQTMQGEDIMVSLENDEIILRDGAGNEASIIDVDTDASNGVVFTIDNVLRPQDGTRNAAGNMSGNTGGNTQTGDTRTSKVTGNK